jgi:hypothetical protein
MMATLLLMVFRGMGRLKRFLDHETNAVVSSIRASALASVVAGSFAAGSADPGMVFFIGFAVISANRARARGNRHAGSPVMPLGQAAFDPSQGVAV